MDDEFEWGEEREIILKAKWKTCVHGGGWWVARDADGIERLLAPDGFVDQLPRADLAQAPAPVRVKKLVWDDWSASHRTVLAATSPAGVYRITQRFFPEDKFALEWPNNEVTFHPTLEAAQIAAQADYEARILAALEPDAGVVAELVEALRGLMALGMSGHQQLAAHQAGRAVLEKLGAWP